MHTNLKGSKYAVDQCTGNYQKIRGKLAVNNVSVAVEPGEIFGLLGPNGAGKTTAIRVILDIFKPDSGKVEILYGPMTEAKKNRIGYLPEERGLYQDISTGTLPGLSLRH
jgi:ABC-2 type transport system ATP-binding protein